MECPNYTTPWKCNGLHLEMVSKTIYRSEYGHFMMVENNEWVWLANEKQYNIKQLFAIMDTLKNLNE